VTGGVGGLSLSEFSIPGKDAVHFAFAGCNFYNCKFRRAFVAIPANTGPKSGQFWSHDKFDDGPKTRKQNKKESPVIGIRGLK